MEPVTWGVIGTIIGAFVGASASVLTSLIAAKSSRKSLLDIEAFKKMQLAKEFQAENLIKLQDLLHNQFKTVHEAHKMNEKSFMSEGKESSFTVDINTDLLKFGLEINKLAERVKNDDFRANIKKNQEAIVIYLRAKSQTEEVKLFKIVSDGFNSINESVGYELRSNI